MAAYLSPVGNEMQADANGAPLSGGKIYTYLAGTTTQTATYTGSDGLTPQANPIVLNTLGLPANPIWLGAGVSVKLVIKDSSDVTIRTVDNVLGVNDPSAVTAQDQWVAFSGNATYLSSTSFSVAGDQTSTLQVGRRVKTANSGGTVYSTIATSSFAASVTTVTLTNDSGTLDSGLSALYYGLLSVTNPSAPGQTAITIRTATTASGQTAVDFSNIPSYARRITLPVAGLSSNGTSNYQVQIGDSGGLSGTGYLGSVSSFAASTLSTSSLTSGFPVTASVAASTVLHGAIVLTRQDASTNTWVSSSMVGASDTTGTQIGAGSKTLTGTLDRVRFTTTGGVNTFDAGTIGLLIE